MVNAYFQEVGREGRGRPAEKAEWDDLLSEKCIVAGDFNSNSPVWNPRCQRRRDHRFLEDLIDTHSLAVMNDEWATRTANLDTREGETNHRIIDLTLASPEAEEQVIGWSIREEPEAETGSDHEVIEWRWKGKEQRTAPGDWKIKGWALKEALDKEKEEAKEKKTVGETLEKKWRKKTGADCRRLGEAGGEE